MEYTLQKRYSHNDEWTMTHFDNLNDCEDEAEYLSKEGWECRITEGSNHD